MKWIALVVVALVVLVAVVALIGSRLPREHVASRTLRVSRPPQDVWNAYLEATGSSSVPVDVVENDPPRRMVTRVKASEKAFGGTWTTAVAPVPGGATITIIEDGWIANPVFRFMAKYVFGHDATLDGVLKKIDARLNG